MNLKEKDNKILSDLIADIEYKIWEIGDFDLENLPDNIDVDCCSDYECGMSEYVEAVEEYCEIVSGDNGFSSFLKKILKELKELKG